MKFIAKIKKIVATRRYCILFERGLASSKISHFEFEIFEKLKEFHYGGFPLNVLIGSLRLSDGKCYDRAMGLTFIFDDCNLVNGNLSRYAKIKGSKEFLHSWVEKDDLVYDTTWGMKFDKKLYYKLMGVKVIKNQTTAQMMQNEWYVKQKQTKFEDNIGIIDIVVPLIVGILESELRKYEKDKDEYYIALTNNLIKYCRDLLEISEVKKLSSEREEFFENMKW